MSVDAVMVIRPRSPALLRGIFDPETTHADVLPDGTVLVSTFARFAALEADPEQGIAILSAYGPELLLAHDEPRGFFFYPDVCEPRAKTYEALLAEVGAAGVWVPARVYTEVESAALMEAQMAEVNRIIGYAQAVQAGEIDPEEEEDLPRQVPSPEVTAEKLRAQMADILGAGVNLEALTAAFAGGTAVFLLMRPARKPFALEGVMLGVNESFTLADGTVVVHTDRAGRDKEEMVALALGETRGSWADLHTDPRGVPVFSSHDLPLVRGAASYDEAVTRLTTVTFVEPKSMDEILAEKKAAFGAFLGQK